MNPTHDTTSVLQVTNSLLPAILREPPMQTFVGLAFVALAAALLHLVTRYVIVRAVAALVARTRAEWDDVVLEHGALRRAAVLVPLLVFRSGIELVPVYQPQVRVLVLRLVAACMILVVARTLDALFSAGHELYRRHSARAARPITGYVQLAKVVVYFVAAIFIVARLADQSPWYFISGLGAMMAIITLVFRDTLLSLVAGIQLTSNDLLRVGDWIEMPQFNADGDVIDIALNTVRVRNWDRTVTVIPAHKFMENSFKNWRSMFEGGGRRIKRSIHINTSTIRFLSDKEIERFSRYALLRDYMEQKAGELAEYNARRGSDNGAIVPHVRRLTNVGTLRAYITAYLRAHPQIHDDMTFLVRQLAPTPEGLPIEIYVFTTDTRWAVYEGIQADVFDHVLAMVPEFGLQVYQRPAGTDLATARLEAAAV
jgi:miniconductance mechanosensitive channel